jgi:hypothetical protein
VTARIFLLLRSQARGWREGVMDDGFVLFVLWISVVLGFFGTLQYYRSTVLSWAEQQWLLTGKSIHFGPVGAICYGTEPGTNYQRRAGNYGALGIVGNGLVFTTRHYERFAVPLASITWLGTRQIRVKNGKYSKEVMGLIVHGNHQGRHFVFAVSSGLLFNISQHLSARCNLRVEELGERSESRGPTGARQVTQDIYGEWREEGHVSLYLAPDRLLFGWSNWRCRALPLAQIREIGAFSRGSVLNSLNPFTEELLRIEYQPTPDGKPQVIGFLVRHADDWADAIQERSPARITVHAGRKKKVG